MMDPTRIRTALTAVHRTEKTSTNPSGIGRAAAAKQVISAHELNADETAILLNALHVAPSEVV